MIGIYKITSPSGKIYIGQSKNIEKRKREYKRYACKNQTRLYHSLKFYGFDSHTFDILCTCTIDQLDELEIHYIKLFNSFENGLNLTTGGEQKKILSEESKQRMLNKKPMSEEARQKISAYRKQMVGELNHMYGKKQSDETRRKIAEKAKGRPSKLKGIPTGRKGEKRIFTEAHKIALSKAAKGRKLSEERKKQISLQLTGKPSRNKGKKMSDESRLKIGIASKMNWTEERKIKARQRMIEFNNIRRNTQYC